MARISMRSVQKSTFEQIFSLYLSAATAKGVKDKTLDTYKQHFRAISKRLDVTTPMEKLTSNDLDSMILRMREEQLSDSSINSYTRTLKVFFSWCNEEGHSDLNLKIYKAPETVKEVYSDEELLQKLMVHSTLKMTRHFCNIFNNDIVESHEQRSPLVQITRPKRETIKM